MIRVQPDPPRHWWQWLQQRRYQRYVQEELRATEAFLHYYANGFEVPFDWDAARKRK